MIQLLIVFAVSTFLAIGVKSKNSFLVYSETPFYSRRPKYERFLVFLVFIALALFAGFRSAHNDTAKYLYNFSNYIPESFFESFSFNWAIGENPGFFLYQIFIKQFISTNPYIFLLVSSIIVIYLFIVSYYKYSPLFYLSVFLFIASGLFVFSMAAMKQVFAMAIGFWSVDFVIKRNFLKFTLLILIASIIHPYILLYLVAVFLKTNVWSKKMVLLLIGAVFIGLVFEYFVSFVVQVNSSIGNTYEVDYFASKKGMNFFRVVIFAVTPVLSLLYRREINEYKNPLLNVSINMSVISLLFMIIGAFGAANMFGRLGNYFEPFTYVALPWIIYCFIPSKTKLMAIFLTLLFYAFFFYYQFVIVKPFEYSPWF